jgi:hypothetical protein
VTIYRRGVPAADIIRTKKPSRKKRKLGTLKGKIQILDIDWWKLEDLDLRVLPYTANHKTLPGPRSGLGFLCCVRATC